MTVVVSEVRIAWFDRRHTACMILAGLRCDSRGPSGVNYLVGRGLLKQAIAKMAYKLDAVKAGLWK